MLLIEAWMVTRLLAGRSGFESQQELDIFLLSKTCRPTLGHTHALIECVPGVERSERDVDHSPSSRAFYVFMTLALTTCYSAVLGFCPVEELADGPTGCGEVARGGCLFARNFSLTSSAVLTVAERMARPNTTLAALVTRS